MAKQSSFSDAIGYHILGFWIQCKKSQLSRSSRLRNTFLDDPLSLDINMSSCLVSLSSTFSLPLSQFTSPCFLYYLLFCLSCQLSLWSLKMVSLSYDLSLAEIECVHNCVALTKVTIDPPFPVMPNLVLFPFKTPTQFFPSPLKALLRQLPRCRWWVPGFWFRTPSRQCSWKGKGQCADRSLIFHPINDRPVMESLESFPVSTVVSPYFKTSNKVQL